MVLCIDAAGWSNGIYQLPDAIFVSRIILFYGVGLGNFGKLERHEIYYVVAATWALQIIWSHIWLRYFRFGPLEWAWRSLTYWKKQPMKKTNTKEVLSP
ncbi:MAG: DUF418 domain-containing protein [Chitinophagaceae bacterium]|nr:DUF418 domain-containing protein [Chitinophagaceae bacterium]